MRFEPPSKEYVASNIRQTLPARPTRRAVPERGADGVSPPPAVARVPAVSLLRPHLHLHLHGFGAQPPNPDEACHVFFVALPDTNWNANQERSQVL